MIELPSTKPNCVWQIEYKARHTHVMQATEIDASGTSGTCFRDVVKGIDRAKAKQASYERLLDLLLNRGCIFHKTWINAPLHYS